MPEGKLIKIMINTATGASIWLQTSLIIHFNQIKLKTFSLFVEFELIN